MFSKLWRVPYKLPNLSWYNFKVWQGQEQWSGWQKHHTGFYGPKWVQNPTDLGTLPETKNSHLNIAWIVRFLSIFKWFHFRQVLQVWSFQAQCFPAVVIYIPLRNGGNGLGLYQCASLVSEKVALGSKFTPEPSKFIPGIFLVFHTDP